MAEKVEGSHVKSDFGFIIALHCQSYQGNVPPLQVPLGG